MISSRSESSINSDPLITISSRSESASIKLKLATTNLKVIQQQITQSLVEVNQASNIDLLTTVSSRSESSIQL